MLQFTVQSLYVISEILLRKQDPEFLQYVCFALWHILVLLRYLLLPANKSYQHSAILSCGIII